MKKRMKTFIVTLALLAGGMGFSSVYAQKVETATFGVKARLTNQLSITKQSDIDFGGIFIPISASATVTMDKTGNVTITNGTTSLYSTELQQAGGFYITADKSSTYTIQYPNVVELALADGSSKLNYTPVVYNNSGAVIPSSASTSYSVGQEEYRLYAIGGNLVIPNTAKSGMHTGNFDLTVTWQ